MTTLLLPSKTPSVMGILNVTPDSFSDGGSYTSIKKAMQQVELMLQQGADIIDIGGESTRPGAAEVSLQDEIKRVIPILKEIKTQFNVQVSIDTSKAAVMAEAITYGADIINDVYALRNKGCLDVMAQTHVPVCLMHMQGKPRTMQDNPQYDDVIADIRQFFVERIDACQQHGINKERLILDPGFGFGKSLAQNYALLGRLSEFSSLGLPLLSGTSRKSMIGNLLNRNVDERLSGSLTTAILAAQQGAQIIRVHDVVETVDALKILQATQNNRCC